MTIEREYIGASCVWLDWCLNETTNDDCQTSAMLRLVVRTPTLAADSAAQRPVRVPRRTDDFLATRRPPRDCEA